MSGIIKTDNEFATMVSNHIGSMIDETTEHPFPAMTRCKMIADEMEKSVDELRRMIQFETEVFSDTLPEEALFYTIVPNNGNYQAVIKVADSYVHCQLAYAWVNNRHTPVYQLSIGKYLTVDSSGRIVVQGQTKSNLVIPIPDNVMALGRHLSFYHLINNAAVYAAQGVI